MCSEYLSKRAFRAEKNMIPFEQWNTAHPEAYRIAMKDTEAGYPTGIAHDPELGWVVVGAGQGPIIIWAEHPELLDHTSGRP